MKRENFTLLCDIRSAYYPPNFITIVQVLQKTWQKHFGLLFLAHSVDLMQHTHAICTVSSKQPQAWRCKRTAKKIWTRTLTALFKTSGVVHPSVRHRYQFFIDLMSVRLSFNTNRYGVPRAILIRSATSTSCQKRIFFWDAYKLVWETNKSYTRTTSLVS